jgi:hypothetical protein
MNNICKYNIKTLVNLRDNQTILIKNDNKLIIDSRYFKNLRNLENIKIIMQIYEHSFYHYLILIKLPNPKLLSTNINLTELNIQEFIGGIFLLLDKSLDGLLRLKKYYEYYNKNDGPYIYSIYKKLKNELNIIKNNFESQSGMNTNLENTNLENTNLENTNLENTNLENTNLENTNLENTNLENTNLEIIILDNPASSGLFVLYNKSYGIKDLYDKTSGVIDLDNLSPLSWCGGWC